MGRRSTAVRAAAIRQARQATAHRDAERLRREQRIESALADYFEATSRAELVRADARERAARIIEQAAAAAAAPDGAARAAVRALRALTSSNAEVADLCGVSIGVVRAMVAGDGVGREETSCERRNRATRDGAARLAEPS
jgi:predicted ArsR family transcriptional regulator